LRPSERGGEVVLMFSLPPTKLISTASEAQFSTSSQATTFNSDNHWPRKPKIDYLN